ncbi:hypothetical protein TrVE_jg10463 [Triparma verrucosa]|uniref:Uncharacterized protein n=1 Tax=Triparma verrucosa TaxID=1606542 RepID=A0A9W7CE66_9STRA|nr:hypothetical protein TrVE_jg10463 [Triparma verrucosa]|mmetsp:Transcript_24387/g.45802  ORF Transcript_24387/g.45802 Transcript_24387/m.45802 type:complete len:573 (+) Transcript_24387:189-1907(+)|eukprot:CAMPEP_0182519314 /NCGR_PEP_ID=MMETSP1321-20130603/45032_1 /TAXON_ID=91990 /ORGANISM="Bolidomonas sp., Strain RCC1657" /LENGTH=572 /DNA_ID=CAMNT_0024727285 /DNA_START=161 /DNA_END=1879 /DNA_ORIENTATION=-
MPPSTKVTPKKNRTLPGSLPRKSSLNLQAASVENSPMGTKTFNLTLGGDDYVKSPRDHSHLTGDADDPDFDNGMGDSKAEAEAQARLVAEMLGEDLTAGDIAARYDMSDSSDDELDELMAESKAKGAADQTGSASGAKFTGEFDWGEQMGPMVQQLQTENSTLKGDLSKKKAQVKKLGIMLNALEPVPGVDAEKLLNVMNEKGEQVHRDMKDVKIIQMAKKIRNITYELNKQKGLGKKAEETILMLDQELEKKQEEIDSLATPQARAAIMKTMVGGVEALEPTGSSNSNAAKKLSHDLQEMRHKFEIMKEKNRVLEQKVLQEVGGEGVASEKLAKIMDDGWKGRAQQIVMLKTKIKRMEANNKTGGMMEATSRGGGRGNATTAQQRVAANNLRHDVDFKAQQELNEMDRMRQQGVEELGKAYEKAKEDLQKVERKFQSAKTRVGCLEQDNAKMRDGMKVFVGKASNDDKLVDMLKSEVQELKKKLRKSSERQAKMKEDSATYNGEGQVVENLKGQISHLQNQNGHQERIINQLRADLHRMRNPGSAKRSSPGKRRVVNADETENDNSRFNHK